MPFDRRSRDAFAVSLALVLTSVTFMTAAPDRPGARLVTVGLLAATLLAAMHAAGASSARLRLAGVAGVGALLVAIIGLIVGTGNETLPPILSALLVTVAPLALARGVIAEVRRSGVTLSAVFGSIAVYLLLGMLFSLIIGISAAVSDHPYFGVNGDGTTSIRLYFSFVTLATLGYGDFTPVTSFGRALAMLEGVLGQLYLVTIVSLLVGNMGRRREDAGAPPS